MTEYCKGRIYPNSVPEFRHLQKQDGTMEMQVRYINSAMVSGFDNPIIAGEWHEIEALEDGTVFVNVFAEGKN